MITNKQRAYLKGLGNRLNAVFQVGKNGVTPEITEAVDTYLEANEIVKIAVLNNCEELAKVVAEQIAGRCRADVVQVIGKKMILYRESKKKPVIELPKEKKNKSVE